MSFRESVNFGRMTLEQPVTLKAYASAAVPSATETRNLRSAIVVTDAAVGSKPVKAMSDGAVWRVTSSPDEVITTYFADIGTAGSTFLVVPFKATIRQLTAINTAANATTKTVLTSKIGVGGAAITHPAWEVALAATAGSVSTVVPTAANECAAGDVIEIISDGGSTAVTPAMIQVTLSRRL